MKTEVVVSSFLNAQRARGLSPHTIVWYEIILMRLAHDFPQMPRKPEPVEKFLAQYDVSPRTQLGYFKALRAFFSWMEKRYGAANPLREMTPPKRVRTLPRTLSVAELGCLFLVPLSRRDRALVSLFLDTGVRVGEAVGLRPQDIGRDTIQVDGKSGPREVPISPQVREELIQVAGGEYVFGGPNGHLHEHTAYYHIRKAFLAAGIKGRKLGPHTLRHTFGRMFIMAGGDAFSLQRILGHSNIQTTRIYVELNTADIVRQHHKFTPLHLVQAGSQGRLIDEAEQIIRNLKGGGRGQ